MIQKQCYHLKVTSFYQKGLSYRSESCFSISWCDFVSWFHCSVKYVSEHSVQCSISCMTLLTTVQQLLQLHVLNVHESGRYIQDQAAFYPVVPCNIKSYAQTTTAASFLYFRPNLFFLLWPLIRNLPSTVRRWRGLQAAGLACFADCFVSMIKSSVNKRKTVLVSYPVSCLGDVTNFRSIRICV